MRHKFHAICPYFAMFPEGFARENIISMTEPGDVVLDPFSGRGTTLLESLLNQRQALACDVNPVAFCITSAKAYPPDLKYLMRRIENLEREFSKNQHKTIVAEIRRLPIFYSYAYHPDTLREIMFLRGKLNWRKSRVDRFIAVLVLGSLHGETNRSINFFSNQMPHTICLKPNYSIRYWEKNGLSAPRREVFKNLLRLANFRFSTGIPELTGIAYQADVRNAKRVFRQFQRKVRAVITSPPYLGITNYEEDQWLRLWFLGGPPIPTYHQVSKDDRHHSPTRYFKFLEEAWSGIAPLLKPSAKLILRIGTKYLEAEELHKRLELSLRAVWPKIRPIKEPACSSIAHRQTNTFRPGSEGCRVEWDFAFQIS